MFGWIRFAYRLLWFIVSAFLLLVPMFILAKFLGASMKFRHGLFKTWRAVFLAAMGIEVRVLEGSAPTEAAILMGNIIGAMRISSLYLARHPPFSWARRKSKNGPSSVGLRKR